MAQLVAARCSRFLLLPACRTVGLHIDAQHSICPKADLVPRQADDTGVAGTKHFDVRATSQPQFFQPVDMVHISHNSADTTRLTRSQTIQEDTISLFHRF